MTLYFYGQAPHYTPVYGVVGKDIKDLQVLVPVKEPQPAVNYDDNIKPKFLDHHVLEHIPPPPFSSSASSQQQQQLNTDKVVYCKHNMLKYCKDAEFFIFQKKKGHDTCQIGIKK